MITPLVAVAAVEPAPVGRDLFLPTAADLLWSAVVVLIIGVAFYRFILPKMLAVLDERTGRIEGGLAKAEEARIAADQTLAMRQEMLDEARADAARTRDEARLAGKAIVAESRTEAEAEAARIHEAGRRQLLAEQEAAAAALRSDVGALATELATKIVGEQLSDDAAKSRTVDRFLDQLAAEVDTGMPLATSVVPSTGQAT